MVILLRVLLIPLLSSLITVYCLVIHQQNIYECLIHCRESSTFYTHILFDDDRCVALMVTFHESSRKPILLQNIHQLLIVWERGELRCLSASKPSFRSALKL